MKKTFFISYSRQDLAVVAPVVKLIMQSGYDVWFDQHSIPGGADWEQAIIEGGKRCDLFLFFMSPDSTASQWCDKELLLARSNEKSIIPLMIRPTSSLPPKLATLQYVNMTTGTPQEHLAQIIRAIGATLPDKPSSSPKEKKPRGENALIFKGPVSVNRNFKIGGEHHHYEREDEE